MRLPLAKAIVATPDAELARAAPRHPADEVNVKDVELTDDVDRVRPHELQVNPTTLGPRLGGQTQQVIKAVKAGDWTVDGDRVVAGGIELEPGEFDFRLVVGRRRRARRRSKASDGVVVLDTDGHARARARGRRPRPRSAWSSRPAATPASTSATASRSSISGPQAVVDAFETHRDLVMSETLATSAAVSVSGESVVVEVNRAT